MTKASCDVRPLAAAESSLLGECPVWDSRLHRLYWVDIDQGELHWLDDNFRLKTTHELGEPVGFIALTMTPEVVVIGCGARVERYDLGSLKRELIAQLSPAGSGLRCNDGKCDPAGRLWAGTTAMPSHPDALGSLFSVTSNRTTRAHVQDLGCSNGLAWNEQLNAFYFIDSLSYRIDRFVWSRESAEIREREPLATFSPASGMPDGMCIDCNGDLWVAFWEGGCLRHIDGRTGFVRAQVDLPCARPTSCAFGGRDLSTLYVTSARDESTSHAVAKRSLAGAVFALQVDVPGPSPDWFDLRTTAAA